MNKKLYLGNGYIGGVCEGLGEWSNIPSIFWRAAFLFIFPYFIKFDYVLWVYLLLWFFCKKNKA